MRVVTVARKPCSEGSTTANVAQLGTGALNIDGTRVAYCGGADQAKAKPGGRATGKSGSLAGKGENPDRERKEFVADNTKGRWPANVILAGPDAPASMDEQSGTATPGAVMSYGDTGGASRYFKRVR